MEQLFTEAVKQSPVLALMLALVWLFLQHLRTMMESHAKRTDEFISAVREIKADDREAKLEDRASRDRNTQALTDLGTEITRLSTIAEGHRKNGV